MRYMGGKNRTGTHIADFLVRLMDRVGLPRIEDRCCGSLAVSKALYDRNVFVAYACDICEPLIRCFEKLRDGVWTPPDYIDDKEYDRLAKMWRSSAPYGLRRLRDPTDPMVAFAGFFASYAGKFFTGLCPDDLRFPEGSAARHASVASARDLRALRPMLRMIEIAVADCFANLPRDPAILYFDPPYAGTEVYAAGPPFDSVVFWRIAAEISDKHAVVVSEFEAPDDWILAAKIKSGSRGLIERGVGAYAEKSERLFVRRGGRAAKALRLT
jgi:site-specific DNA-adenine methylase